MTLPLFSISILCIPMLSRTVQKLVYSILVMLVVPLGILGAVIATMLRGIQNDVYFKVGLLTTVGVSARNAILIVEFAKTCKSKAKTC